MISREDGQIEVPVSSPDISVSGVSGSNTITVGGGIGVTVIHMYGKLLITIVAHSLHCHSTTDIACVRVTHPTMCRQLSEYVVCMLF